jgi:diguanylate cyclase (GGDEF)-like protein
MKQGASTKAAGWTATLGVCGTIAVAAILAIAFGHAPALPAPNVFAILVGSNIAVQFGSASIVLMYAYGSRRSAYLVVGAAYLLAGFMEIASYVASSSAALPVRVELSQLDATSQYAWLIWHVGFPASIAFAIVLLGRGEPARPPSRAGTAASLVAVVTGVSTFGIAAPLALRALGHALASAPLAVLRSDLSTPESVLAILALDALALAVLEWMKHSGLHTTRVLVIGLFAFLIDALIGLTSARYSIGWYAGAAFNLIASCAILVTFAYELAWRGAMDRAHANVSLERESERREEQERLVYLAFHDELTGLNNRAHWQDVLRTRIAAAESGQERASFSVLFIDLDRFKDVNDAAGHAHGDAILVETASRLRLAVRANDAVGRLGGDEFAILCEGLEAQYVAERIRELFRVPFVVRDRSYDLSATIGIANYPDDGTSVEDLLKNADQALYYAKRRGGDAFVRFDSLMAEERRKRHVIREALASAIANEEFQLYYQPIYDLRTCKCESLEALIRWNSATLGHVPPSVFIPVAEETDLMRDIGRWGIDAAIKQLNRWNTNWAAPMPTRIAVNVSVRQLRDPAFLIALETSLQRYDVDPQQLELEVTESAAMADTDACIELLRQCRSLGVRVTLDDFGTHYSSLTYLQRLPVDTIKIDRSFVSGLPSDQGDAAIVRGVINLGHDLKRTIVAEGIEKQEQLDWLRRAGCDYVQGFFLARPMSEIAIVRCVIQEFWRRSVGDDQPAFQMN